MLKCRNLSKNYYGGRGVEDINLEVCNHDIFALLGPNGSGKSTLIKMITGLSWPDDGEVTINGYDVHNEHSQALKLVGAVIEWPAFMPYLTARQNLKVLTGACGRDFTRKMEEIIELVNMSSRLDDKVQNFSTGMKQRLGLALALLPDSQMIILDEPTNGLDPNGIIEIRRLLCEFNRQFGTTIFFTSHLLGEVEHICSKIAIIHKGRIVASGKMQDLLYGQQTIILLPEPLDVALKCIEEFRLKDKSSITAVNRDGERIVLVSRCDCVADINSYLVGAGIKVHGIYKETHKLEHFFMKVTEGETDVK